MIRESARTLCFQSNIAHLSKYCCPQSLAPPKMADPNTQGNLEENVEGVNLLYLAAQKKLQTNRKNSQGGSNTAGMSENSDAEPTTTLAELAKTVAPKPSTGEPQHGKRDKSPSPQAEFRMSSKHRIESQKSFAQDHLVGSICPKVNCPEKIVSNMGSIN